MISRPGYGYKLTSCSIGAGFFVGSGSALQAGGAGSVLIGFLIMGVMLFNVVYALGELAVMYPVSGGFYT